VCLAVFPNALPPMFDPSGGFTVFAKAVNLSGGVGYFVASAYFFASYQSYAFGEDLIFLVQCSLLGAAGLLFSLSTMWDMAWWSSHLVRFFSYLIVLRNIFTIFRNMQVEVISANLVLADRIRQLDDSNAALELVNQELESFSYSISHDLGSPLCGIHGFSEALAQDYAELLDVRGKKYLSFIQDGVKKMGVLIDDLLSLSRISRSEMRRSEVYVDQVAVQILERFRSEATAPHVLWNVQPHMQFACDPGLVAIILENLLSNAWKFSGKTPSPLIEVGTVADGDAPILFVRDNGAGFDMRYYDKLFGVFQRLHSGNEFSGTGIGLAIVRRAVSRHGGKIWADSKVGSGATFFFTLSSAQVP
jgi:light-regulated signal transduction histidine kinase (bacteriophytochrome)